MSGTGKPLPSAADVEDSSTESAPLEDEAARIMRGETGTEEEGEEEGEEEEPAAPPARPARPPAPGFKISTFIYVFLGLLGLWMLIDQSARNSIAGLLGTGTANTGPLYLAIGFNSNYLLLTMLLAGAIEMLITSVAYNYTTDWVKAAKVQKWSAAFRKVQMAAIRSGKKDRIAALKPHQERLTRLSGEVSIAQFKGMAITYFLLILIYTWVGLVILNANAVQQTVRRESLGFCLKADGGKCHVVPQKERCYATFSGDLAPAFMVLDAEVEIAGSNGRRRIPLTDLYDEKGDGIRRLKIQPGELLVAVHLPPRSRALRGRYRKLRVRPSYDFPELGVAVAGSWDGHRVESLSVAVGGVEPYPRRFDELTDPLVGETLSEERVRTLADAITRAVRPVHNTFLLPDYRRRMVSVYVRRAIAEAKEGGAG
jgi:CO/xanthine dehydrogenase FAD-binding subunit